MQDFFYERIKAQEAERKKKPFDLYRRDTKPPMDTERFLRDFEYFKSLYPEQVRWAQRCVEEVCDAMEYEGSPIYDEYPDRIMLEGLICRAEQQLPEQRAEEKRGSGGNSAERPKEEMALALEEGAACPVHVPRGPLISPGPVMPETSWGVPGPGPVMPEASWGVPGPGPVVSESSWGIPGPGPAIVPGRPFPPFSVRDLLAVLLMNELQGRRCRFGRCK